MSWIIAKYWENIFTSWSNRTLKVSTVGSMVAPEGGDTLIIAGEVTVYGRIKILVIHRKCVVKLSLLWNLWRLTNYVFDKTSVHLFMNIFIGFVLI